MFSESEVKAKRKVLRRMVIEEINNKFDYQSEVEQRWGETKAYNEYCKKTKNYSKDRWNNIVAGMDDIIKEFSLSLKDRKCI